MNLPAEMSEIIGRGDSIRNCDPLLPKQVLYQAELRPDAMAVFKGGRQAGQGSDRAGRGCAGARYQQLP